VEDRYLPDVGHLTTAVMLPWLYVIILNLHFICNDKICVLILYRNALNAMPTIHSGLLSHMASGFALNVLGSIVVLVYTYLLFDPLVWISGRILNWRK
jgi:hypothetical protein